MNQAKMNDLMNLYQQRVQESNNAKQELNKIEASVEINIKDFYKRYDDIDPKLLDMYNLRPTKNLKEMSLDELREFHATTTEKVEMIYSNIMSYLNTGNISDLNGLEVLASNYVPPAPITPAPEVGELGGEGTVGGSVWTHPNNKPVADIVDTWDKPDVGTGTWEEVPPNNPTPLTGVTFQKDEALDILTNTDSPDKPSEPDAPRGGNHE